MIGYNLKIQEFHNGEVKFSIYPEGISEIPDEQSSWHANECIERNLERAQREAIYNPFTGKVERLKEFESAEIELQRRAHSQRVSVTRSKNKIHDLARSEKWEYFVTLTFDGDKADRYSYEDCLKKCRVWLNHQHARYALDLAYLFVPEKHKDGAYHFHGLMANVGNIKFSDSGRVAIGKKAYIRTEKNKSYPTIFNLEGWRFGYSTATKVSDCYKATNYITKYVTKDICADFKGKHRYIASKNLHEPTELKLLLTPGDCSWYSNLMIDNDTWLRSMVQKIAENHGYDFKYESVVDGFKKAIYQIYQFNTDESEVKENERKEKD